jgi:hypothetical protein
LVIIGKKAWQSEEELQLIAGGDHVRHLLTTLTKPNDKERRFLFSTLIMQAYPC